MKNLCGRRRRTPGRVRDLETVRKTCRRRESRNSRVGRTDRGGGRLRRRRDGQKGVCGIVSYIRRGDFTFEVLSVLEQNQNKSGHK